VDGERIRFTGEGSLYLCFFGSKREASIARSGGKEMQKTGSIKGGGWVLKKRVSMLAVHFSPLVWEVGEGPAI